jgi:hypothetical protein
MTNKVRRYARVLARLGFTCGICAFAAVVSIQFARIIERNVTYARAISGVKYDLGELESKRTRQQREIRRLSDPAGAIPEIHDKLHLVSGHEAIIYLKAPPHE